MFNFKGYNIKYNELNNFLLVLTFVFEAYIVFLFL